VSFFSKKASTSCASAAVDREPNEARTREPMEKLPVETEKTSVSRDKRKRAAHARERGRPTLEPQHDLVVVVLEDCLSKT
jgi:hypothetical protein